MLRVVEDLDLCTFAELFFRWRGLIPDTSVIHMLEDRDLNYLQWILYDAVDFDAVDINERLKLQGIGVIIKDWKRPCNFKVILTAENIQRKFPHLLQKMLVISVSFSPAAEKAAEKTKVLLLTRGELVSIYKTTPDFQKFVDKNLNER